MQSGYGTGADGTDAADLWVRDPRTGEYRMLQPGETAPRPAPQPAAVPDATAPTAPSGRRAAPAGTPVAPTAAPRRASRRRERPRSGPWVAAAACFLLAVGGTGGYLLLHRPGGGTAGGGATARQQPVASCSAHPAATGTGPVPEPAVSGVFLQGSRATAINVRVTVLNGTGTIGQAETLLTWLQSSPQGFLRSSNGGPAGSTARTTTLVYAPDHVDQARTLAAAMGLPATALHGDGTTTGTIGRMVLTLGQDYHGIGKPFAAPSPAASATADAGTKAGCGSQ